MDRHSSVDLVKTLARSNNPQTSKDAAEKMVKSGELSRQEKMVYDAILGCVHNHTKKDFTTKDIAAWLNWLSIHNYFYDKAYDICRKRFSGLERKGKIEIVWERCDYKRRDGCRVWRLK